MPTGFVGKFDPFLNAQRLWPACGINICRMKQFHSFLQSSDGVSEHFALLAESNLREAKHFIDDFRACKRLRETVDMQNGRIHFGRREKGTRRNNCYKFWLSEEADKNGEQAEIFLRCDPLRDFPLNEECHGRRMHFGFAKCMT